MKRSKYSESQVVKVLSEVEAGKTIREVCRAYGLCESAYHAWPRKYGGREQDDVKRLRELDAENSALKRIVADQVLVIDATSKQLQKGTGDLDPNSLLCVRPCENAEAHGRWDK